MLRIIIIDDEAKARRILEGILKEYCTNIEIVATAGDVPSAVKEIQAHQPDLIFLDIEMPKYTGFQLFDFIKDVNFDIIFTTAYSEYALQAFQVSAIDYLLKPIQIDLLVKAVEKVQKQHNPIQMKEKVEALKSNVEQEFVQRIALPVSEGLIFVEIKNIVYLHADGSYTNIILNDGKKILISKNIKSFEDILKNPVFFRTHRSYLINLNHVRQYIRQDGGYIVMDNGDSVDISKERKDDFIKLYQSL